MLLIKSLKISKTDDAFEVFDLILLATLSGTLSFSTQLSEIASLFLLASTIRCFLLCRSFRPSIYLRKRCALEGSIILLSLSILALLFSSHPSNLVSEPCSWHEFAVFTFWIAWVIPISVLLSSLVDHWLGELTLKLESVFAALSSDDLATWETVQLVLVKVQSSFGAPQSFDSHPRVMITVMKSKTGCELLKANGRINSQVVGLDSISLQPKSANFLKYSFDDVLSTVVFKVQV